MEVVCLVEHHYYNYILSNVDISGDHMHTQLHKDQRRSGVNVVCDSAYPVFAENFQDKVNTTLVPRRTI